MSCAYGKRVAEARVNWCMRAAALPRHIISWRNLRNQPPNTYGLREPNLCWTATRALPNGVWPGMRFEGKWFQIPRVICSKQQTFRSECADAVNKLHRQKRSS